MLGRLLSCSKEIASQQFFLVDIFSRFVSTEDVKIDIMNNILVRLYM